MIFSVLITTKNEFYNTEIKVFYENDWHQNNQILNQRFDPSAALRAGRLSVTAAYDSNISLKHAWRSFSIFQCTVAYLAVYL